MAHNGLMSALDSTTRQVRLISEVPSGEGCQCVCAECDGKLIARKGRIRAHHFAHKQGEPGNASACQETALHNAAKRLLAYHLEWIAVPSVTIQRPTKRFVLPEPNEVRFEQRPILEGENLTLEAGDIEPALAEGTAYRPDAFAHAEPFGKVYFEVHVTHPVPDQKKAAYQELGLWVLEIDLSECDPGQIGLERLKELLESEAKRHWLSWDIPGDIQSELEEYESTVARLSEEQKRAFQDDLQKPIPEHWARDGRIMLTAVRYKGERYPVKRWIPAPAVSAIQGYRVTQSIADIRLPVFWECHEAAVTHFHQEYQAKRQRGLSYVLASSNEATITAGDQSRLVAIMQWVLEATARTAPGPVSHIQGLKRLPNPDHQPGSPQLFKEEWGQLWADPPLADDKDEAIDFVSADVPAAFARACIRWSAADMVVLADGTAFADQRILKGNDRIRALGEVYTAIRVRCDSISPLPCKLILEEGGHSRSLNITRHLRVRDGNIYLQAMGIEIPTDLTVGGRRGPYPIQLVPGLSYSDESALFRANENRLESYLNEQLQHNRDTMSQYVLGDALLASFVAYFRQRSDGT